VSAHVVPASSRSGQSPDDEQVARFRLAVGWMQQLKRELRSTRLSSHLLIGALCAVLLGIGASLAQTISAERRAREQVELTTEALSLLRRSLQAGTDVETGQRGFLLTGNSTFLEPYERGSRIWLPTLARLHALFQKDTLSNEDGVVARLEKLAAARLAISKRTLDLAQAGKGDAAVAIVARGLGKRIMDDYRATVSRLEGEQAALQRQAMDKARAVEARAVPIIVLLGASIFGLVIGGFWLERRTAQAEAAARDAEGLREAHARAELLARELNHRVKNLFAVILSIVILSAREETDVKRLVANIRSRIYALSLAHGVSQGQSDAANVRLGDLISAILKPYEDEQGRVRLEGGEVRLPVEAVTPLGLVIHELATNAAKYGAFSTESGSTEVCWNMREGKAGPEVELLWKEHHGPAVTPEREAGFGSILLEKAALQLGGRLERDWLANGVCARLVFPLEVG